MQLQELTTYEDKSHLKIVRVHFVIADHADPTKRKVEHMPELGEGKGQEGNGH